MKLSRLLHSEDARQTLDLTLRLTQRSVSSEFKGTALGRLWSFINPLATIAIFALIFGVVFRGGVEPGRNSGINSFALWIGIGVLSWTFFSSGIMASMNALVDNAGLLTKVYFPRQVLIYSAVLSLAVDFAFELLVLVIIAMILGGPGVLAMIPALLVVTVLVGMFAVGLGLMLSIATVYFRDLGHLWQIFNQMWMYASGVVFPLTMVNKVQNDLFDKGWQVNGGTAWSTGPGCPTRSRKTGHVCFPGRPRVWPVPAGWGSASSSHRTLERGSRISRGNRPRCGAWNRMAATCGPTPRTRSQTGIAGTPRRTAGGSSSTPAGGFTSSTPWMPNRGRSRSTWRWANHFPSPSRRWTGWSP